MERNRKKGRIPICPHLGDFGQCTNPGGASAAKVVEAIKGAPLICGVHVLGEEYCSEHPSIIISKQNIEVLGQDSL